MRKFVLAAAVAGLALAMLAVPASAGIDHHFRVIAKGSSFHETSDGFRFREQLFQIDNPDNQVGNDRVHCRERGDKLKCRALIHLNGEVGGLGFLRVNGNLGHGDNRLNILGGTDDFAGVAGKIVTRGHFLHFDLVG